ncbi:MAG: STAS domain-containing protein [Solirubrobacterales bacterium]|nr:STAS domain-containing protein [Solirubrobacterales bacterium]
MAEDVHWADVGTLDVIKLLARRVEALPVLALVTFRDDQLRPVAPLQIVLGELAGAPAVERRHVPPLSLEAVRTLAGASGAGAERLFERTGGNPFFVTEALAAMNVQMPDTVRWAVLARAAHLPAAARRLLEAVAVVPSRVELWLVQATAGYCLVGPGPRPRRRRVYPPARRRFAVRRCVHRLDDRQAGGGRGGRRRLPARGGLRACVIKDAAGADSFPGPPVARIAPSSRCLAGNPTPSALLALAGPSFEIRENLDADGVVRLALVGELDIAVADTVEERLRRLREGGPRIRLDLSGLEFIDSSGVRAIVLGLKHAREGGHELDVDRRVSAPIGRMIEIMGIGPQLWPGGQGGS